MPHSTPFPRLLPAISEVHDAAERLRPVMANSRLLHARRLSETLGVETHLKLESENPTGSFKIRGAYNALATLPAEVRVRGVVASSAGNHGLGVAFAARALDIPATLYLPRTAPAVKKEGIRALGATVIDDAPDYDAAHARAVAHAEREGVEFVNPCAGMALFAGQGTVALELLAQLPSTRTVVIPVGGAGLLGGMGTVLRALAPTTRVVGVQSVETAAMARSLDAGRVVEVAVTPTLADGLAGQIDETGLHVGRVCADDVLLVSEEEIGETIAWLFREHDLVVEGSGAVTVAALRAGRIPSLEGPVVAVVSGRNIDPTTHAALVVRHASG